MLNDSNLLTTGATARRLRVKAKWLRDEADAGRLPGVRAGDDWLFHFPTVVKLLEERAVRGDGEEVRRG
jgi:hypothetical protein